MAILRVQDQDGNWHEVPAIVGPAGPQGEAGPAGPAGPQGEKGADGNPGANGKTPEKGVDYFTEADKTEMVQAVLDALPVAEGASF